MRGSEAPYSLQGVRIGASLLNVVEVRVDFLLSFSPQCGGGEEGIRNEGGEESTRNPISLYERYVYSTNLQRSASTQLCLHKPL